MYSFHRDEAYWPDAEAFRPERFLSPASEAGSRLAYMPFGEGARACPGAKFASQEVLLALLRLYQRFVFRLTPGQVPLPTKTVFTMVPKNGEVRCTVHKRG
jgi:cytochrome P450